MAYQSIQELLDQAKKQNGGTVAPTGQKTPVTPIQTGPAIQQTQAKVASPNGNFFDGNIVSKAFDTLLVPYYGYSGFLKGMENKYVQQRKDAGIPAADNLSENYKDLGWQARLDRVKSGVKNIIPGIGQRVGIGSGPGDVNVAKQQGIKNETAQAVMNFATSLAIPSLPVGKIASTTGKVLSKVPGVAKVVEQLPKVEQAVRSGPIGKAVADTVDHTFQVKGLRNIVNEKNQALTVVLNDLAKKVKNLSKGMTPEEQAIVGHYIEGNKGNILIPPGVDAAKAKAAADEVIKMSDAIGKRMVDAGVITKAAFEKYQGKYLHHFFTDKEPKDFISFIQGMAPKLSASTTKARKGVEGYVEQFAPATFKGLGTSSKLLADVEFYKKLASQYGMKMSDKIGAMEKDMVDAVRTIKNEKVAKYFKGMAIPKGLADYINKVSTKATESPVAKVFDKVQNAWKAGKTVYNPGYHTRNIISNQILTDLSTGNTPETLIGAVKSARQLAGKGDQKFANAAERIGLIRNATFQDTLEGFMKDAGIQGDNAKPFISRAVSGVNDKISGFQQGSEEAAKLNVFTQWVNQLAEKAGITADDALKNPDILKQAKAKAEEAIFSPSKIPAEERKFMSRIVPFYSFTRQAAPFIAKTAVENPGRLTKYKQAEKLVENLSPDRAAESSAIPEGRKGQVRLPVTNKEGKSLYFDPTYIYPWGNFNEGDAGKGQFPLGFSVNPFLWEAGQQIFNKDAYFGGEIANSSLPEENTKKRISHATRMISPTLLTNITSKLYPAISGKPDYAGRTRDIPTTVLDSLGMKSSYLNPDTEYINEEKTIKDNIAKSKSGLRSTMTNKSLTPEKKQSLIDRYKTQLNEDLNKLNILQTKKQLMKSFNTPRE